MLLSVGPIAPCGAAKVKRLAAPQCSVIFLLSRQGCAFILGRNRSARSLPDMSATSALRPVLPPDIRARKGQAPLVVLTAYTTPVARLVDPHCDIALVGDSVGMVLHGMPSTLGVTMVMMILHGRSVVRGLSRAMAVIDMPFGSYEESPQQAYRNAARLMAETGAPAVHLGGGARGRLRPWSRMRALLRRQGRSRWCWRRCRSACRHASRKSCRFRRLASARAFTVTGRCWWSMTCWACSLNSVRNL